MESKLENPEKSSWIDKLPYPKTARAYWLRVLPMGIALALFTFSAIIRLLRENGIYSPF